MSTHALLTTTKKNIIVLKLNSLPLIIVLQNAGASDEVAVKSRDIGSSVSTPSKRKHKKKLEATSTQISSADTQTQTSGDSSGISFNIILGVALVSVIIGVILGKRY